MLTQIDPKRLRTSLASLSNETPDSDTNTLDATRCFFLRKKRRRRYPGDQRGPHPGSQFIIALLLHTLFILLVLISR